MTVLIGESKFGLHDILRRYASKIALTAIVEGFHNLVVCSKHESLELNPYHSSQDLNSGIHV